MDDAAELVREVKHALRLARADPADGEAGDRGVGGRVPGPSKDVGEREEHLADVAVAAERALRAQQDADGAAPGARRRDGQEDRGVPGRVAAAGAVGGDPLPRPRVAG